MFNIRGIQIHYSANIFFPHNIAATSQSLAILNFKNFSVFMARKETIYHATQYSSLSASTKFSYGAIPQLSSEYIQKILRPNPFVISGEQALGSRNDADESSTQKNVHLGTLQLRKNLTFSIRKHLDSINFFEVLGTYHELLGSNVRLIPAAGLLRVYQLRGRRQRCGIVSQRTFSEAFAWDLSCPQLIQVLSTIHDETKTLYHGQAVNFLRVQMTEQMISDMVKEITGSYIVPYSAEEGGEPVMIDFSPPWRRISMIEGLEEATGTKFPSKEAPEMPGFLIGLLAKYQIECPPPRTVARMVDTLARHFLEEECINPTVIVKPWPWGTARRLSARYRETHSERNSHRGFEDAYSLVRMEIFVSAHLFCSAYDWRSDDPREVRI